MITFKEFTELDEGLSLPGRRKQSRRMKLAQPRMRQARKRAARKTAPQDKLLNRAMRRARNQVAANFLKGRSRSSLSHAQKGNLERYVASKSGVVKQKAKRVLPKVRKDDRK